MEMKYAYAFYHYKYGTMCREGVGFDIFAGSHIRHRFLSPPA